MQFWTGSSRETDTDLAVEAAVAVLRAKNDLSPGMVIVSSTGHHDPLALRRSLTGLMPEAAFLGSSACRGFRTDDGRRGRVPDPVWLHASPGSGERVIRAVRDCLGQDVLISGGSSADEAIAGKWSRFDGAACGRNTAGIAIPFTDAEVSHHFQSGYVPSDASGIAIRADGRVLHEIDGRPAAEVYDARTGGAISAALEDRSQSILEPSARYPLGKSIGRIGRSPAVSVNCCCPLRPVSEGPAGERIVPMASGADVLEERATGVIRASLEPVPGDHRVLGGLMVFCAGCMLALGARIAEGGAAIAAGQDGVPFLCMFAFGEQGSFVDGGRQHGNPMISNTLFSAPPERANHVARP